MGKRFNPYLAKIHRNYTIGEASDLLGVHKNTVSSWIKKGLSVIDEQRPYLILGSDLREFLCTRQQKNKRRCSPGTIYCVRCKEPKIPLGQMVDFVEITTTKGDLVGICPDCDSYIHQFIGLAKLEQVQQFFDVSIPLAGKHISGCA